MPSTSDIEKINRTFQAEKGEYLKFKSTLAKDGKDVGETINEFIRKFNLEFGDGNPAFVMDQWFENPKMIAIPAVMRAADDWWKWYVDCKEKKMIQEIVWQAQMIAARGTKRLQQF